MNANTSFFCHFLNAPEEAYVVLGKCGISGYVYLVRKYEAGANMRPGRKTKKCSRYIEVEYLLFTTFYLSVCTLLPTSVG